jgi:hypothetical protein
LPFQASALAPGAICHLPSAIGQKSDDLMIWMISMSRPVAQQCPLFCFLPPENDIYLPLSEH